MDCMKDSDLNSSIHYLCNNEFLHVLFRVKPENGILYSPKQLVVLSLYVFKSVA